MTFAAGWIGSKGFTVSSGSRAEAGMVAVAALAAVSALVPARHERMQILWQGSVGGGKINKGTVLHQAEGRATAFFEHHQLHYRISFRSPLWGHRRLGANALDRPLRDASSHQPYSTGQSSMASTVLRLERNFRHLGPARIDEGLAPDGDKVGTFLAQDVLGEMRSTIKPTAIDHDAGLPAHALGETEPETPTSA